MMLRSGRSIGVWRDIWATTLCTNISDTQSVESEYLCAYQREMYMCVCTFASGGHVCSICIKINCTILLPSDMGEPHSKEAAREDHATKGPTFSSGIKRSRAGETVSSVSTLAVKKNNQDSVPVVTSTLPSPSTVRKKHRIEGEKVCKVCGDKAATHHFDVMTCESCKTFFRRNANKPQVIIYWTDEVCSVVNMQT